jgi:hypothetical protein
MKWDLDWNDPFTHYLESFETLVGDRLWYKLVRAVVSSPSLAGLKYLLPQSSTMQDYSENQIAVRHRRPCIRIMPRPAALRY